MTQPLQTVLNPTRPKGTGVTPAGLQSQSVLASRRAFVFALNAMTLIVLAAGVATLLGAGGWSVIDVGLFVAILLAAPWTVLGFWNALIGLWLMNGKQDTERLAYPFMAVARGNAPVEARTAVIMTLRNEDPDRALARLDAIRVSLESTGWGDRFDYFILSDTSDRILAKREEELARDLKVRFGAGSRLIYRRRACNVGFKAGNIRDFVDNWGATYEFMLPLDADSLMAGETIIALTRVMQAHPRIGILQSLVPGAPTPSAFARIFQFGMRQAMRCHTMGSAWWAGDCGPYWGHNALVRIAPFAAHCRLPVLPGKPPLGGSILSHDQIEAALMRRAGYEVRVIPFEMGSWEDNPPDLVAFTRRDLRWCQGNMQYWWLLGMPGLVRMSRFQLLWAAMMYLTAPAWMMMTALAAAKAVTGWGAEEFSIGLGAALFGAMFIMSLTPKCAGFAHILFDPTERARHGGAARIVLGALLEVLFAILMAPVIALRISIFIVGLAFGRRVGWNGQSREAVALSWRDALRGLWPQTLYGFAIAAALAVWAPAILPWAMPVLSGLILAVPLAVVSASPSLGACLARARICAVPEEIGGLSERHGRQIASALQWRPRSR